MINRFISFPTWLTVAAAKNQFLLWLFLMALLCAAIKRYSASLLSFPFQGVHFQAIFRFSLVQSPQFDVPFQFFLVFVVFLSILLLPLLLLASVISFSFLFLMLSSSPYLDTSTQFSTMSSPLPSFLDTHSL